MGTKTGKKSQSRVRKVLDYGLFWVQETAPEIDPKTGQEIPGTERPCLVRLPLPPGLNEHQRRNRNAIKAAVRRAVYEHKMKEYGNKLLVIAAIGEPFEAPFVEVTETKLVPVDSSSITNREQSNSNYEIDEDGTEDYDEASE